MGYLKKIRDAKIRNSRPTRQKRLECPPKNNCFNCGNAEHEEEPLGINCLLHGWYFPKYVAIKSTCDKWSEEA